MQIVQAESRVSETAPIVLDAFRTEVVRVSHLPREEDYRLLRRDRISHLFANDTGVVAVEAGKLVGFLVGYPLERFFGTCKGIFTPVFGHGVADDNKPRIYQQLYTEAASHWVSGEHLTHAVAVFAHRRGNR